MPVSVLVAKRAAWASRLSGPSSARNTAREDADGDAERSAAMPTITDGADDGVAEPAAHLEAGGRQLDEEAQC